MKELLEFILPIENIEIYSKINNNRDNLINLELESVFQEYPNKNLALIFIEDHNKKDKKITLKQKDSR